MMRLLKRYIGLIIFLGICLLLLIVFRKQWLPSLSNIFKAQPVVIDDTPILIKEINELAQLCTITTYNEVIADSVTVVRKTPMETLLPDFSGFQGLPVTAKRLVIIGKGTVVAGTDLKNIDAADIFTQGDSIFLRLPRSEILDAIMNPTDFEIFSEMGRWEPDAITAVKIKARDEMVRLALEQQILEKADNRSKQLLENFLFSIGYNRVEVAVGN